jgi:hypothetical protein
MQSGCVALVLLMALCCSSVAAEKPQPLPAGAMYRYENAQGVTVLDDHIPPEFVGNGYAVLAPSGRVLQEVPPALTPEEVAEREREQHAQAMENARARAQLEYDRDLLIRYSSVADIRAVQKRRRSALESRIIIEDRNRDTLEAELERQLQQAARMERAGEDVPALTRRNVENMRLQIAESEALVAKYRQDIERTDQEFAAAIARFRELKGEEVAVQDEEPVSAPPAPLLLR